MNDDEKVPCSFCGEPTAMLGTKLCNACWVVDLNIDKFAKTENGRARMAAALEHAARKKQR